MAKSNFEKGSEAEEKVARSLRGLGAHVEINSGTVGAVDLKVEFPSGTKRQVQVVSSAVGAPKLPDAQEAGRLKQSSTKQGATLR